MAKATIGGRVDRLERLGERARGVYKQRLGCTNKDDGQLEMKTCQPKMKGCQRVANAQSNGGKDVVESPRPTKYT